MGCKLLLFASHFFVSRPGIWHDSGVYSEPFSPLPSNSILKPGCGEEQQDERYENSHAILWL